MQFTTTVLALLGAAVSAVTAVTVSYDQTYDNSGEPLTSLACSDGANGLITRYGYSTLGQVPTFGTNTGVGAAEAVSGWNSPNCGTCWQLSYNGRTITVTAVDHAAAGFVLSLGAMNALTNGNAVQFGRIDATATQVANSECGL